MLYTQEDNTLVEEIRKMGKGNRVNNPASVSMLSGLRKPQIRF